MLAGNTPGAGAHFGRGQAGGVIDIDVPFFQQNAHSAGDPRPVLIVELAGTDAGLIHARQRRQGTHHDLLGGHLQTEDQYRFILQHRRVFDEVHRKSGFTHRRSRGDDNQIRGLKAGGLFIEIVITSIHAGDAVVRLLEELLDTGDGGVEHVGDVFRPFVFIGAAFGDFKDPGLSQVQQFVAVAPLGIEAGFSDFVRHGDHIAHNRTFAHDIGISADVRRTWRIFGQFCQIGKTADAIQLTLTLQRLGEGDQIDGAPRLLQARHFGEDVAVRAGIKIIGDHALGDIVPAFVIQH